MIMPGFTAEASLSRMHPHSGTWSCTERLDAIRPSWAVRTPKAAATVMGRSQVVPFAGGGCESSDSHIVDSNGGVTYCREDCTLMLSFCVGPF
jgi:hypothetical protein